MTPTRPRPAPPMAHVRNRARMTRTLVLDPRRSAPAARRWSPSAPRLHRTAPCHGRNLEGEPDWRRAGRRTSGTRPGATARWSLHADASDLELVTLGAAVYTEHCASCHGRNLEGEPDWRRRRADGTLPAPPHDATGHTWHHPDELLFRMTREGPAAVVGKGYRSTMTGFAGILDDREIWASLAYIKSRWPAVRKVQGQRAPGSSFLCPPIHYGPVFAGTQLERSRPKDANRRRKLVKFVIGNGLEPNGRQLLQSLTLGIDFDPGGLKRGHAKQGLRVRVADDDETGGNLVHEFDIPGRDVHPDFAAVGKLIGPLTLGHEGRSTRDAASGRANRIAPVSTRKLPSQDREGSAGLRMTTLTCVTPMSSIPVRSPSSPPPVARLR